MSVIIKLLSKFDDSGIKKAKSGFGGLAKTVGAIGIGFGISQLSNTLIESAKAAQDDIKSQSLLAVALKRNTKATDDQIAANENYITSLSKTVGVSDDILRPALADLTRTTGSLKKAQELLGVSFDAATMKGKSVGAVETAIAKAYNGSTTSLSRMFPELKKVALQYEKTNGKVKTLAQSTELGRLMIDALAEKSKGMAAEQATPFDKMTVALDELKEKLGMTVLPLITDFIEEISKPGGAIEVAEKFLDDLANPKSDVGKTFTEIKDAVGEVIGGVKDFFGYFGDGDAMEGFKNIATSLIQALPALLALKGIMMLASGGKAIASLAQAIGLMTGANAVGGAGGVYKGGGSAISKVANSPFIGAAKVYVPVAITAASLVAIDNKFSDPAARKALAEAATSKFNPANNKGLFVSKDGKDSSGNTVVNINVTNADPKATVVALTKYLKQNGKTLTGTDLRQALG